VEPVDIDSLMTKTQMAETGGKCGLPYDKNSIRIPLRELGIEQLGERGVPGTKTSRVAGFDPNALLVLALAYNRPKSWPSTLPLLKERLAEYRNAAAELEFTEFEDALETDAMTWLSRTVSYWRLVVDPELGLGVHVLDRVFTDAMTSFEFDLTGTGVLVALLESYREARLRYLGQRLGGVDGVPYDAWELLTDTLTEYGVTAAVKSDGSLLTDSETEVETQVQRLYTGR